MSMTCVQCGIELERCEKCRELDLVDAGYSPVDGGYSYVKAGWRKWVWFAYGQLGHAHGIARSKDEARDQALASLPSLFPPDAEIVEP